MKVLYFFFEYWNARGLANKSTKLVLRKLRRFHNPDFLFLAKLWIDNQHFPPIFFHRLKLKCSARNSKMYKLPNIWCLSVEQFTPRLIAVTNQHFPYLVRSLGLGLIVFICYIYRPVVVSTLGLITISVWIIQKKNKIEQFVDYLHT